MVGNSSKILIFTPHFSTCLPCPARERDDHDHETTLATGAIFSNQEESEGRRGGGRGGTVGGSDSEGGDMGWDDG